MGGRPNRGLACWSVFILFTRLEAVTTKSDNFVYSGFRGVPGVAPMLSTTVGSKALCAMECLLKPACQSFSWKSGGLGCRLFPRRIMALDITGSSQDAHFSRTWASCPAGTGYKAVPGANRCIAVGSAQVPWTQALEACAKDGGHLLIIENADVMQRVMNILPGGFYRVGFNDMQTEDQYIWLDGTAVNRSLFMATEPSDATTPQIEDCGLLRTMGTPKGLADISCTWNNDYVCSLPLEM